MKSKIVGIRMTDEEKRTLEREAKRHGMTTSAYVKYLAKLRVSFNATVEEKK